jgi:hypothetical protein
MCSDYQQLFSSLFSANIFGVSAVYRAVNPKIFRRKLKMAVTLSLIMLRVLALEITLNVSDQYMVDMVYMVYMLEYIYTYIYIYRYRQMVVGYV